MSIQSPYLLFIGDVPDALAAKTAQGVVDWRPERCAGQMRMEGCGADLGIPDMTIEEAVSAGAKTFVVGAHVRLQEVPEVAAAAEKHGVQLHNLRHSDRTYATGKGTPRSGKRLLAVGTDCSVGKKYSALCIERDMKAAGYNAEFCATGQTGLLIADRGVALDAVVADFISGAAEYITPETDENNWQIVEGQGSLFHPSFSGVTLGLLHGSQPDALVVCHEPTRTTMRGVPTPLPSIQQVIDAAVMLGKLTNPDVRCVGICVNTLALEEDEAKAYLAKTGEEHGLPCVDPLRFGAEAIVAEVEKQFGK